MRLKSKRRQRRQDQEVQRLERMVQQRGAKLVDAREKLSAAKKRASGAK